MYEGDAGNLVSVAVFCISINITLRSITIKKKPGSQSRMFIIYHSRHGTITFSQITLSIIISKKGRKPIAYSGLVSVLIPRTIYELQRPRAEEDKIEQVLNQVKSKRPH